MSFDDDNRDACFTLTRKTKTMNGKTPAPTCESTLERIEIPPGDAAFILLLPCDDEQCGGAAESEEST
jgi:hypothetical protein